MSYWILVFLLILFEILPAPDKIILIFSKDMWRMETSQTVGGVPNNFCLFRLLLKGSSNRNVNLSTSMLC